MPYYMTPEAAERVNGAVLVAKVRVVRCGVLIIRCGLGLWSNTVRIILSVVVAKSFVSLHEKGGEK